MNQRLLAEIGRTQRLEIVNALKRSRGLSVNELVDRMRMSYMGIKQHCLTLQRDGYLDTWRRPQKMGRPEMVYRLTRRAHDLFQADSNRFTLELLDSVQGIYGPNAPEKLLYNLFERKCASLKEKVKGATMAERAKSLARIRDTEGYMSQFVTDEAARRYWNATRRSRTCSINIQLLAGSSRKCSSSFSAHECAGEKHATPGSTSARSTLTLRRPRPLGDLPFTEIRLMERPCFGHFRARSLKIFSR